MCATYTTGLLAVLKASASRYTCGIVPTRKGMSTLNSECSVAIRLKLPSGCRKWFCMSTMMRAERVMSGPMGGDGIGGILGRVKVRELSIADHYVAAGQRIARRSPLSVIRPDGGT